MILPKLGRFEKKILIAMAGVAAVPLIGALLLGRAVLKEAYEVGVNPRVRAELETALEVNRALLVALREDAERTADAVARGLMVAGDDPAAIEAAAHADLQRYSNLYAIALRSPAGPALRVARPELPDPALTRVLELERQLPAGRVTITAGAPVANFDAYRRLGELVEVFSRLESSAGYVQRSFLFAYVGLLLAVIVLALTVGILVSRRVTRRVAMLVEATDRVGAGDLRVRLPGDARDEVGDLSRAFNAMVRDLGESRSRIAYLQRIGGWQEFARRLAHEIKNPLTPIQLAVQEAHHAYSGDDARYRQTLDDALAIVTEEVATLRRLVTEFSAFARLPAARLEPAELAEFVDELRRPHQLADDAVPDEVFAGLSIRHEAASEAMPVLIDSMMLKRTVDNLCRNAAQAIRRASKSGEQQGIVLVQARPVEGRVRLEVHDSGPGIAEADRDRVFDPYFTTRIEGTGLGLAIAKKVVLEHGGQIGCARSPELGGAMFWIELPLRRANRSLSFEVSA